jgi:hypothetical protein
MKFISFYLPACLVIFYSCGPDAAEIRQQTLEQFRKDASYLASDELGGREIGSEGERLASAYIAERFREIGLAPKGDSGSFFQNFDFVPRANPHVMQAGDSLSMGMGTVKKIRGSNVLGFIDNQAAYTIVIGAHFDHLGMGDENSLFKGEPAVHNGADDNASGVAVLIELAERLKNRNTSNNYLIMAFSGEEKGLWGSNYFCKNPLIPLESINYMLNMDMVGRLNEENKLAINGVGTSPAWMPELENILIDSISLVTTESGVGPSDHTSFYLKDIPVLHFFTGQHEDYHKPSDDLDKLNFEGMLSISDFVDSLITRLDSKGKIAFSKTKDQDNEDTPRFSVTLGVVPDYLFTGEGMRIDGVSEGKVAQRAGLSGGDIVIALGDSVVRDMMSYMRALSAFSSGDSATVKVRRDQDTLSFPVIFD